MTTETTCITDGIETAWENRCDPDYLRGREWSPSDVLSCKQLAGWLNRWPITTSRVRDRFKKAGCFTSLSNYLAPLEAAMICHRLALDEVLCSTDGVYHDFALAYAITFSRIDHYDFVGRLLHRFYGLTTARSGQFSLSPAFMTQLMTRKNDVHQAMGKLSYTIHVEERICGMPTHSPHLQDGIGLGVYVRPKKTEARSLWETLDHANPWEFSKQCFNPPSTEVRVGLQYQKRMVAPAVAWAAMLAAAKPFIADYRAQLHSILSGKRYDKFSNLVSAWIKHRRRVIHKTLESGETIASGIKDLQHYAKRLTNPSGFRTMFDDNKVVKDRASVKGLGAFAPFTDDLKWYLPVKQVQFDAWEKEFSKTGRNGWLLVSRQGVE